MRIAKHFFVNAAAPSLVFVLMPILALVLLQISCAAVSDEVHTTAGETTTNESASLASPRTIIADFRIADFHTPVFEPDAAPTKKTISGDTVTSKVDAKLIVDAAMGTDAFERYRLADSAHGYFTGTEQLQSLHVIVNRKVTAVAKKVTPSIIVIFQDDRPVTQFVPDKASYLDIASAPDIDKDGLNEVVLTASAYQMGSRFVAADVYNFKNSNDILKQELGVVYIDACDSVVADDQQVRASVLFTTNETDELMSESYLAPCDKNGQSPSVEAFTVEPAQ